MKEEGILESALVSCEDALSEMPKLILEEDRKTPTLNGLETHMSEVPDGFYRLYTEDSFLGIGTAQSNNVKLKVNLYSEKL